MFGKFKETSLKKIIERNRIKNELKIFMRMKEKNIEQNFTKTVGTTSTD